MKSYNIHLIRHGTCEGNKKKQYIGSTDSPLAEQGKQEILELDAKGAYKGAKLFYTSPLSRCIDTLKLIYPNAEPIIVNDLRECDFGDWEGKTYEELLDNPDYIKWIDANCTGTPKNGEPGDEFMNRTNLAFEKIVEHMMRTGITDAVIVAHGGSIMSILSAYGIPKANFYDWMCEPGHGYTLKINPGLWMRDMVAEVWDTIPPMEEDQRDSTIIDIARDAADKIFSSRTSKKDSPVNK